MLDNFVSICTELQKLDDSDALDKQIARTHRLLTQYNKDSLWLKKSTHSQKPSGSVVVLAMSTIY